MTVFKTLTTEHTFLPGGGGYFSLHIDKFDLAIVNILSSLFFRQLDIILHSAINIEQHLNTVKPSHAVTSIKQSPILKGHNFLVQS